ncbi:hypothetical protein PN36_29455 [Candidatus Thiomargarita nelsonii]|uniref:Uncharacterized protein n=1 Tax=Candidatus Thiomargarita nelsonii TaxID=1003181 RepID=A0A4E0QLF7_9GAMM|nr:hypothetical protein PN36_29455 [Candidatus Thiomargarita nelsonii]
MSSLTQNQSKKQAQLQQQLAKRQQALAKIERYASLSNKKAQIDLLNAKIHLNEVPSEDKIGQLYAQAKVKEAEADKALAPSDEDEPDDNTEPSSDIASTLTETSVSQLEDQCH